MDCCEILFLIIGSEAGLWGFQIHNWVKNKNPARQQSQLENQP